MKSLEKAAKLAIKAVKTGSQAIIRPILPEEVEL